MNATLQSAYRAARKSGHSAKSAIAIAREQEKLNTCGLSRYPQDAVLTIDGILYTIRIQHDDHSSPFEWDCFYAVPEHNRHINRFDSHLDPGHIIISGYSSYYDYDRDFAIKTCLRQNKQWPRCTRFELACEAVDAEIDYWRQWLNDDRYFIGLTVTAESSEGFTADSSCYGIEAGDRDGYWRSVASDLIADCQHEITRQRIARVYALNDALTADVAGIEFAD